MALEYITTRDMADKEGNVKGKVKIMKVKEDTDAMLELTCPNCGKTEKRKEKWSEPFVTGEKANQKFNIKCTSCGLNVKLLKLKKQAKKEAKADLKKGK